MFQLEKDLAETRKSLKEESRLHTLTRETLEGQLQNLQSSLKNESGRKSLVMTQQKQTSGFLKGKIEEVSALKRIITDKEAENQVPPA